MDANYEIDGLLVRLKLIILASPFSRSEVLLALKELLLWLNKPENNSDNNCRKVDYFVANEIIPNKKYHGLPEDIKEILFDMGATLHDTHNSPRIAENFYSTPAQLLERVQKLISQ